MFVFSCTVFTFAQKQKYELRREIKVFLYKIMKKYTVKTRIIVPQQTFLSDFAVRIASRLMKLLILGAWGANKTAGSKLATTTTS